MWLLVKQGLATDTTRAGRWGKLIAAGVQAEAEQTLLDTRVTESASCCHDVATAFAVGLLYLCTAH